MSVYLQFDSLARSDAFIKRSDDLWYPNDPRYNPQKDLIQAPADYKVYYRELNDTNNLRTLNRLQHCRERPENLTFSVEFCHLTLPACTRVQRPDGTVVNIADEPYVYIRVLPEENSEGTLIYKNKSGTGDGGGDESNFIAWLYKLQVGTDQDNATDRPPGIPGTMAPGNPTWDCPAPLINQTMDDYGYTTYRWCIYRSCMVMPMRLDLDSTWHIKFMDRYGGDLILYEDAIGAAEKPTPNPSVQTSILLGITPNYPVK